MCYWQTNEYGFNTLTILPGESHSLKRAEHFLASGRNGRYFWSANAWEPPGSESPGTGLFVLTDVPSHLTGSFPTCHLQIEKSLCVYQALFLPTFSPAQRFDKCYRCHKYSRWLSRLFVSARSIGIISKLYLNGNMGLLALGGRPQPLEPLCQIQKEGSLSGEMNLIMILCKTVKLEICLLRKRGSSSVAFIEAWIKS